LQSNPNDLGQLSAAERTVVKWIVAFYDAAGAAFKEVYIGKSSDNTAAKGSYARILRALKALHITAKGVDSHRDHFHIRLEPTDPVPLPQPLNAQDGTGDAQPAPAPLTDEALAPIVSQAIARWADAGADAADLEALRKVQVQVGDLPPGNLGLTT